METNPDGSLVRSFTGSIQIKQQKDEKSFKRGRGYV